MEKEFYWQRFAEVERQLLGVVGDCVKRNPALAAFEADLLDRTSTRLLDWVDHLILPDSPALREQLTDLGFAPRPETEAVYYRHPGVMLPGVVLAAGSGQPAAGLAIRVEEIDDFLRANSLTAEIEGRPCSGYRRALVEVRDSIAMLAVERSRADLFTPSGQEDLSLSDHLAAVELWRTRDRNPADEAQALADLADRATALVAKAGQDRAAHIVCQEERRYWQASNFAGRTQKTRQDTLGLGWANHDHHTFRSSRANFGGLIRLFTILGFQKRERFYAGGEAGWGAQVMENPVGGLVLFLDVDLAPDEVAVDFTTQPLRPLEKLGTVGLWCGLHGDSIFKAGMHHLAGRFVFDRLIGDLADLQVEYMAPFSDFPYLKQAFSKAEPWEVMPERLDRLLGSNLITNRQAENFLKNRAVGSHLENIQRREGYKGFNRKNVSAIIRETDPRKEDF